MNQKVKYLVQWSFSSELILSGHIHTQTHAPDRECYT